MNSTAGTTGTLPAGQNPLTYNDATRGERTTLVQPAYMTVANSGQNGLARSYGYKLADDPVAAVAPTVADREVGLVLRTGITAGSEVSVVDLTLGAVVLIGVIRVGVLVDFSGVGDTPASIRLTQTATGIGGTAGGTATVAIPDAAGDGNGDIYFFNLTGSVPGDAYTLYLTDRAAGNANVAYTGLTFDSVPEPATAALACVAGLGLLARRRRVRRHVGLSLASC